jgi:hypothetical protein
VARSESVLPPALRGRRLGEEFQMRVMDVSPDQVRNRRAAWEERHGEAILGHLNCVNKEA